MLFHTLKHYDRSVCEEHDVSFSTPNVKDAATIVLTLLNPLRARSSDRLITVNVGIRCKDQEAKVEHRERLM
jgi:hypothetical protein